MRVDAANGPLVPFLGVVVVVVAALVGVEPGAGVAEAAPAAPVARCTLSDPRLDEASGLAVTPAGPAVVNDSGNATVVFTLAPDCSVASARVVGVTGRDVEDLARGADGTLWLADIGDNDRSRATIALIRLPARGTGDVHRLVYPDGPHDAETLLLPADGRPVIVTKDLGGRSGIYTTDVPPTGVGPTPLRHRGELLAPRSSTDGGPVGPFGRGLFTGGALSVDGRVAAVRTYTDAWLYRVDGDPGSADAVVAALGGAPVGVPLPGEPQGEAIAFTADGTLLSTGEAGTSPQGGKGTASLRAVPGAAGLVALSPSGSGAPGPSGTPTDAAAGASSGASGPGSGGGPGIGVVLGAAAFVAVLGGALLWVARARLDGGGRRGRR